MNIQLMNPQSLVSTIELSQMVGGIVTTLTLGLVVINFQLNEE